MDANSGHTPSTPDTRPRWADGTWSGKHGDVDGEHGVEEQLGQASAEEDGSDVQCHGHDEGAR